MHVTLAIEQKEFLCNHFFFSRKYLIYMLTYCQEQFKDWIHLIWTKPAASTETASKPPLGHVSFQPDNLPIPLQNFREEPINMNSKAKV